jgi:hypothetical protein
VLRIYERHARLLMELGKEYMRRRGVPEKSRGLLTRHEIIIKLSELPAAREIGKEETIDRYATELRRMLKEAVAEIPESIRPRIDLIENERSQGFRIGPSGIDVFRRSPQA